jgi:hypothetical protein
MGLAAGGIAMKSEDILTRAGLVAAQVNIRQFETALDAYYIDHGSYPASYGAAAMVETLIKGRYIKENVLLNANDFIYQPENNGQDYTLEYNK